MARRAVAYVPGIRPNSFLFHVDDGFYYTRNGGNASAVWFRCSSGSCFGTAVLQVDNGFHHMHPHNHPSQPQRHIIQAVRSRMTDRAASVRYASFADIVEEERRRLPDRDLRSQLTYRRVRSAMQRARSDIFPNIPATLLELSFILRNPQWDHLTRTLDNYESMYCCSVTADDGSHSIIFTSRRLLDILKTCNIIFLDGTFKITPSVYGCYQVFTIVTVESHTVLPLVWCLMESKSESAYLSVLLQIRARIVGWAFRVAVSDYEDAIINAVELVFAVEVQGCYFHFVQALGLWAKSSLTLEAMNTFPQLLSCIRRCCALPLLPQNLLQRGMNIIVVDAQNGLDVNYHLIFPFLEYVQWDWIGHVNRGRTLSVCGSDHRTNNASESNNSRMLRRIQVAHPNIYHFLRNISEFEDATLDDKASLARGLIPTRHRARSTVQNDENIARLTSELQAVAFPTDEEITQFLNNAAFSCENLMYDALGIHNPRRRM